MRAVKRRTATSEAFWPKRNRLLVGVLLYEHTSKAWVQSFSEGVVLRFGGCKIVLFILEPALGVPLSRLPTSSAVPKLPSARLPRLPKEADPLNLGYSDEGDTRLPILPNMTDGRGQPGDLVGHSSGGTRLPGLQDATKGARPVPGDLRGPSDVIPPTSSLGPLRQSRFLLNLVDLRWHFPYPGESPGDPADTQPRLATITLHSHMCN